jgi:DNA ligase (NAD+)
VGQVVAETLATHLGSLGELLTRDLESLKTIPDVGEIVAESIVAWRQEPAHQSLIQDLESQKLSLALPATTKDGAAGPLTGHVAVVTGTLPTLSRKAATELLKAHGAIVGSGVSKVTTFLLAGEDAGSKLKKAQELGLPILDEQQVLQWINSRLPPAEVAPR